VSDHSTSGDEREKDRLLSEIQRAKAEAEHVKQLSAFASRYAQNIIDFASPVENALLRDIYNVRTLREDIDVFGQAADSAQELRQSMATELGTFGPAASGVANTALSFFSDPIVVNTARSTSQYGLIEQAQEQLNTISSRAGIADTLREHMRRLDLDRARTGTMPALLLFEQALSALESPSGLTTGGVNVLIGMRSCMEVVLQDLLSRLPNAPQKHKKTEHKIQYIAGQAQLAAVPASHFAPLLTQYHDLHDDLCAGKDKLRTREALASVFNRAVAFLSTLLSGLDETKFKPRPK
jgi:hypothetical protein